MAHSGQGDTHLVFDPPVTDVAGDEVGGSALCWIVFVALHMDEDRDFGVAELVDDTLLALGYRDNDEREDLAQDGQPHVLAVVQALDHMAQEHLVDLVTAGRPLAHYKLTAEVVDDILKVRDGIGRFWGFAGSADAIDSYAELGLLAIMALRIQGGKGESREDLLNKLASLLGDRSEDARELALADLLSKLKVHDYVEDERDLLDINPAAAISSLRSRLFSGEKEQRPVFGTDWVLNDKAWGGLSALRTGLSGVFRDQALPDGGALTNSDDSQDSSSSVAEQPSRDPEASRRRPRSRDRMRRPSPPPATDEPIVSDIDLCVSVLESLPIIESDRMSPDELPTEEEIISETVRRLQILPEYAESAPPPWAENSEWASGLAKSGRQVNLLAYRMEHVLRALSIDQTGLIRDMAIDSGKDDRWYLTPVGTEFVQTDEFKAGDVRDLEIAVGNYFAMHQYADWVTEPWMTEVVQALRAQHLPGRKARANVGGRAFEKLVHALLRKEQDITETTLQGRDSYLDKAGVDIVAHVGSEGSNSSEGLEGSGIRTTKRASPTTATLLVQCKRHFGREIPADAASKLFATTAWLRAQAARGELEEPVAGALLAFFGDLSREGAWTFWALKSAWEAMAAGDASRESSDVRGQAGPDLLWEIWDGQRVFKLMLEHEVGVRVDGDGTTVDRDYFNRLIEETTAEVLPESQAEPGQ